MVFIIQDKKEPDQRKYCASRPTLKEAQELIKDCESFDRELDEYIPDRYSIKKRGYCYNDYSSKCGYCTTGICMLDKPDIDCPLVRKISIIVAKKYA